MLYEVITGGSYAKGQLVMHNNGMYVAKDAISNDAAFDGADFWTLLDESGNSAINGISVASISVAGTEINAITTVITSYSIHYTKLYDLPH